MRNASLFNSKFLVFFVFQTSKVIKITGITTTYAEFIPSLGIFKCTFNIT